MDSDAPAAHTVVRRDDPRIEFYPDERGQRSTSRLGGYYETFAPATAAAEMLALDVVILFGARGYWLCPLAFLRSAHDGARTASGTLG